MITMDACSWDRPGHSPFSGDVPAAVAHYTEIPSAVRVQLRARMQRHDFDDTVEIRRETIRGKHDYTDLRSMHFGNRLCKKVSRAKWADAAVERALIYCESDYCVAVPSICSNLSRITRLRPPERAVPPALPAEPPPELVFEPPGAVVPPLVEVPPSVGIAPPETFEGGGAPPAWWPPVYGYFAGPPAPPIQMPMGAIPEPSTWLLTGFGTLAIALYRSSKRNLPWSAAANVKGISMNNAESMRRGAREANMESDANAQSRALGEAVGGLTSIVTIINQLSARLEALELRVRSLEQGTEP